MINQYYQQGIIPRITLVSSWCFNGKNGVPAICGGDFCFRYKNISLLPNQQNPPLNTILSPYKLALKYAEAWRELDASIIAPYLDKDFHYSSTWVFDEIPSRYECLCYLYGKFLTLRKRQSEIEVGEVMFNHLFNQYAIPISQNGNDVITLLETNNGRITSAQMYEYVK